MGDPDPNFVQTVKEYLEICNDIEEAKREMKDVNDHKKVLEERISEYMTKHDKDTIETGDGFTIKLSSSKVAKPVSKTSIIDTLIARNIAKDVAEKLAEDIYNNREVRENTRISRIAPRKKKNT